MTQRLLVTSESKIRKSLNRPGHLRVTCEKTLQGTRIAHASLVFPSPFQVELTEEQNSAKPRAVPFLLHHLRINSVAVQPKRSCLHWMLITTIKVGWNPRRRACACIPVAGARVSRHPLFRRGFLVISRAPLCRRLCVSDGGGLHPC